MQTMCCALTPKEGCGAVGKACTAAAFLTLVELARCHGPGLLKCTGRNFLPHQNHFGTNSSVMLIHFFLFLLITTTRQPDGKSTRMDVHFSELLLGSGGTGIQSSKSCPENEQESSKFASAAALRRKCASAGIFTLCLQACAQRRQASTGQRRGKEEPAR